MLYFKSLLQLKKNSPVGVDMHPWSPILTTQTQLKLCAEWTRELVRVRTGPVGWAPRMEQFA